jgi:uncharacterized phage protein gp47/JayE
MPWLTPTRRDRRLQVRDHIAAALPGADASVPNSILRVLGDAMAALTHDNDLHLAWLARQMLPDTAEDEYLDRWAGIWLPEGRKGAQRAAGQVIVTGEIGAAVATHARLIATAYDAGRAAVPLVFRVVEGRPLTSTSVQVPIEAITPGALGNLDEGARLAFEVVPDGVDGQATVAAPGLAGGADIESDRDLQARLIDRIQMPPHGGAANDYVQWALEIPGVTRAWARSEMGPGTLTLRILLDEVRSANNGLPEAEDLALVRATIDARRPVTVADFWVLAPTAVPLNLTITDLASDTPETRGAIATELRAMLRARAAPGQTIYASWIREAISTATGEDHHDIAVANVVPASAGHIVVPGTVTYT